MKQKALDGDMKEIKAYVIRQGKAEEISLYVADMTPDERKIVKAGCLITNGNQETCNCRNIRIQ